mgnify:FL=1
MMLTWNEIESILYVYWFKITNPIHTWMTFMSFYYGVVVALQRVLVDGCDIKQKIDNIQSITIQINCRIWMEWMEENIKLHRLNGPPSSHISLQVHFHCHLEASIHFSSMWQPRLDYYYTFILNYMRFHEDLMGAFEMYVFIYSILSPWMWR